MDKFTPVKPMRYPRADGTTMSQIEFYEVLTDPQLNLQPIADVVEPITRAEQVQTYPEIVIVR